MCHSEHAMWTFFFFVDTCPSTISVDGKEDKGNYHCFVDPTKTHFFSFLNRWGQNNASWAFYHHFSQIKEIELDASILHISSIFYHGAIILFKIYTHHFSSNCPQYILGYITFNVKNNQDFFFPFSEIHIPFYYVSNKNWHS